MLARENPFRTEIVLRYRYVFAGGQSMSGLVERFDAMNCRAAIVGEKGRGKTTLVEDFCDYLVANGRAVSMLRLNTLERKVARQRCRELLNSATRNSILVLDGAEQLNWLEWRWFQKSSRNFRGLLVTTHQPGRLDQLIHCESNVETLKNAVSQIAPSEACKLQKDIASLFAQHHGNIRECLRSLYDRYACLP